LAVSNLLAHSWHTENQNSQVLWLKQRLNNSTTRRTRWSLTLTIRRRHRSWLRDWWRWRVSSLNDSARHLVAVAWL